MSSAASVDAGVQAHLSPGETLRAAIWVSRADGRTKVPMTRSEMSPFRIRFRRLEADRPGDRRGVNGRPDSLAVRLDGHIRTVAEPRVLALTDRRLLLLSRPGRLFRSPGDQRQLRWECPRADLTSATATGGRLRLTFRDGSGVTLLTPAAAVQPFLDA
jgi:hypothetical protein